MLKACMMFAVASNFSGSDIYRSNSVDLAASEWVCTVNSWYRCARACMCCAWRELVSARRRACYACGCAPVDAGIHQRRVISISRHALRLLLIPPQPQSQREEEWHAMSICWESDDREHRVGRPCRRVTSDYTRHRHERLLLHVPGRRVRNHNNSKRRRCRCWSLAAGSNDRHNWCCAWSAVDDSK